MQDTTVKVTKVTEEQAFAEGGKPVSYVRVEYTVGAHGPFYERVLKADFNAQTIQQKLQQTAQTIAQLTPNT